MGTTEAARRPVGVTVLVVLIWIQAVLQMIAGLVLIFSRNDPDVLANSDLSSDGMLFAGIVALVLGLIYVAVANAVGNGSRFARAIVAIVATIDLIGGILGLFSISGHAIASSLFTIVIAGAVLYILFGNREAQRFFRGA